MRVAEKTGVRGVGLVEIARRRESPVLDDQRNVVDSVVVRQVGG